MSFTTYVRTRIWYIVFLLAVAYFVYLIRSDMVQNSRLRHDKASMTESLSEEKAKQASLKNRMDLLKSDQYVEKVAREKLGLVGQGESPFKVIIK